MFDFSNGKIYCSRLLYYRASDSFYCTRFICVADAIIFLVELLFSSKSLGGQMVHGSFFTPLVDKGNVNFHNFSSYIYETENISLRSFIFTAFICLFYYIYSNIIIVVATRFLSLVHSFKIDDNSCIFLYFKDSCITSFIDNSLFEKLYNERFSPCY